MLIFKTSPSFIKTQNLSNQCICCVKNVSNISQQLEARSLEFNKDNTANNILFNFNQKNKKNIFLNEKNDLHKKFEEEKLLIDDNLFQGLFDSSLKNKTNCISNDSLQLIYSKPNHLLKNQLNRHNSLILQNQYTKISYNNKFYSQDIISEYKSQQNSNLFYEKNSYDWIDLLFELTKNEKYKKINSLPKLQTFFTTLCPIHCELIKTYNFDKSIKVTNVFFSI